jgi:Predicted acyltransferases
MLDSERIKNTKRADQLQFLRFCAFLVIFCRHTSGWAILGRNIIVSLEAISFFFTISGFVTGYSAYGKEINLSFRNVLKDFRGRLSRLYPLYFFTTIFSIILEPWFSENIALLNFKFVMPRLVQLFKNLLLIQSWPGSNPMAYNGVGWFLSVLIFLQLFNVPIAFILNKIDKK